METKVIFGAVIQMKNKFESNDETKEIIISILIVICFILTVLFKSVLNSEIIYTHFFYLPITISIVWWDKKGLLVPLILSSQLILLDLNLHQNYSLYNDLFRSSMFFLVSFFIIATKSIIDKKEIEIYPHTNSENPLKWIS